MTRQAGSDSPITPHCLPIAAQHGRQVGSQTWRAILKSHLSASQLPLRSHDRAAIGNSCTALQTYPAALNDEGEILIGVEEALVG
jgi:hypothetical protein